MASRFVRRAFVATSLLVTITFAARLEPRADCSTIQVNSGDSCSSLAQRCGITGDQFMQYNPQQGLCANLQPGQYVCCSSGTLPDHTPKQNPDGTCASYAVQSGDSCSSIGASHGPLTVQQLESFNKQTWGWNTCNNLFAGTNMCLSTGTPPMPLSVQGTVCGPQVPGTQPPGSGQNLSSLNPCPLRACCDIWGQCGTTEDFCVDTNTGAPGTARTGTNGCISNCGTNIVMSSKPASFMSVGYFEAFNVERPCLNMDITQVDKSKYTHIHYAFGEIGYNYTVSANRYYSQFSAFTQLTGVKRIISFGGWTFSTDPSTYTIFRQGVTAANRDTFATNIANFVIANNLDGVDIDWEYPAAPDIPGIPPGNPSEGNDFVNFLGLLYQKLKPKGKTISMAAPASFWYLKGIPMINVQVWVDYVVYMTYDLHGQWDYNNKWSDPGCPGGNCLRSHVNLTETLNALSMITKAGVASNKIAVGVSSYGRSFQMLQAGCTGPMCPYAGPASGATKGPCTGTAGYISNAEINSIIAFNPSASKLYDVNSDSNILVYDTTQYINYMNDSVKANRIALYQALNFGGYSDWAVDLQQFVPPVSIRTDSGGGTTRVTGSLQTTTTTNSAGSTITTIVSKQPLATTVITTTNSAGQQVLLTEVLSTTTDAAGRTITITGTLKPVVTTNAGGSSTTSLSTVFPPPTATKTIVITTTDRSGKTTTATGVIRTTVTTIPGGKVVSTVSTDFPLPTTFPPPPTSGKCLGPQCLHGSCTGPLCAVVICTGSTCDANCQGSDCTSSGCIGPDCSNGACIGPFCKTHGCVGADCFDGDNGGDNDNCFGSGCLDIGCVGVGCGNDQSCFGPLCRITSCTGPDCVNGQCVGSRCTSYGCSGNGCTAPNQTPDPSNTCSRTTISSCAATVFVTTTVFSDLSSTTTKSTTRSSCATITACNGVGTTSTTTVSTSTTVDGPLCAITSCLGCSMMKRATNSDVVPRAEKLTDYGSRLHTFYDNYTVFERDVRGPGQGDWDDFYTAVASDPNTAILNIQGTILQPSTWISRIFADTPQNILVRGLYGCTSVVAVSHRGVWASHFWEVPSFANVNRFQADVIGPLQNQFAALTPGFFPPQTQVFIFSSSVSFLRDDSQASIDSMQRIDWVPKYPAQISNIKDVIRQYLPNPAITAIYRKNYNQASMNNPTFVGPGGYGKVAILYDPSQSRDPVSGATQISNKGIWQVYLQSLKIREELWDRAEIQIWRTIIGSTSANVAAQSLPGGALDVCGGAIGSGTIGSNAGYRGAEVVPRNSGTINIEGNSNLFSVTNFVGQPIQTGCSFTANYDAGTAAGAVRGSISCTNGFTAPCTVPLQPDRDTCGTGDVNNCGVTNSNGNCNKYYELLARCVI